MHWVIALIAGLQGDEVGRLAATKALEDFGSSFVDKTKVFSSGSDVQEMVSAFAVAYSGLLAEFGMLKGPDGNSVGSFLKVERTRIPQPEEPAN